MKNFTLAFLAFIPLLFATDPAFARGELSPGAYNKPHAVACRAKGLFPFVGTREGYTSLFCCTQAANECALYKVFNE